MCPLPIAALQDALTGIDKIFVMEEACSNSGIGLTLAGALAEADVACIDLGHGFVTHGALERLYKHCGLDAESVADRILEVVRDEN